MNQSITLGTSNAAVTTFSRAPEAGILHRLAGLFRRSSDRFQTIRQLNGLSDEMLRDIGVDRLDIEGSVDALIAKSDEEARRIPR